MIYRNELAPVGDKFAQYMVGYMYLAARGVDEDAVRASAWYRLAAERGHESFVRARDVLWQSMNDEQRKRSDQIYADLRQELGDIAIISKLIAADIARLRRRDAPSSGLSLIPGDSSDPIRNNDYARRVGEQVEARMNYLTGLADVDETVSDQDRERIDELRQDVAKVVKSIK
jgi:TPR repeat protein